MGAHTLLSLVREGGGRVVVLPQELCDKSGELASSLDGRWSTFIRSQALELNDVLIDTIGVMVRVVLGT